ncbi:MAG: hypothetical protein IPL32_18400 [Chloracidobacterium sp.]|nr:hypothetical protein [Chloracidobacterium sp.]
MAKRKTDALRVVDTDALIKEADDKMPFIGQMVHFVTLSGRHRPAVVVNVNDKATKNVNLIIFLDGPNDGHAPSACTEWANNVDHDNVGRSATWHYVEI